MKEPVPGLGSGSFARKLMLPPISMEHLFPSDSHAFPWILGMPTKGTSQMPPRRQETGGDNSNVDEGRR